MLKQKARLAVLWSSGDIVIKNGINFGVTILLARLLTPTEFGTVALLAIFTGIAGSFVDAGFSSALVQKKVTNITEESTVLWFNLILGTIAMAILWITGPLIAAFYELPVLSPLIRVMAVNIIISALASVPNAILIKKLNFRLLTKINAISIIISSVIAVLMAWYGFGVWSLAAQMLSLSLASTILTWHLSTWRPSGVFSFPALKQLFGFGGYLFASSLLNIIFVNSYTIVIGRYFRVADLGHYQRATGLSDSLSSLLSTVVGRVSFPLFSSIANDKDRLHRAAKLSVRATMLFNVPAMLGLFVVAESAVLTLYGDPWRQAVPYLKILAIAGLFLPMHSINLNLLLAQGYSKEHFYLEMTKKIAGIAFLIVGAWYGGVIGVAWATLALSIISFYINSYFTLKNIGYGFVGQLQDVLPILAVGLLMILSVFLVGYQLPEHSPLILVVKIATGVFVYYVLVKFLKLSAFTQTMDLLRKVNSRDEMGEV